MTEETARTCALAHAMATCPHEGADRVLIVAQKYYEFLVNKQPLREVPKAA